jgi:hypothetical protein
MVFVFKTNVQECGLAEQLRQKLLSSFPHCKINFDLQDCDKILRVEGHPIESERIIRELTERGILCQPLE